MVLSLLLLLLLGVAVTSRRSPGRETQDTHQYIFFVAGVCCAWYDVTIQQTTQQQHAREFGFGLSDFSSRPRTGTPYGLRPAAVHTHVPGIHKANEWRGTLCSL